MFLDSLVSVLNSAKAKSSLRSWRWPNNEVSCQTPDLTKAGQPSLFLLKDQVKLITLDDSHMCAVNQQTNSRPPGGLSKSQRIHKDREKRTHIRSLFFLCITTHIWCTVYNIQQCSVLYGVHCDLHPVTSWPLWPLLSTGTGSHSGGNCAGLCQLHRVYK